MEIKLNSGSIFKNEKKSDKAPDYKGKVNVNGKVMEVALWVKEGSKGQFFSASFQEPYVKPSNIQTDNFRIDSKDDMPF